MCNYSSLWCQGQINPVLLQQSLHCSFLMVAVSQAWLLLNLFLGTIQHIYIGDFIWNWRESVILLHFTPSWIKGWMNFLPSFAVVSENVVLFLMTLHQSCSEETLWLTRSSSLGTCSRNTSAKCLATELLLLGSNCLLFARWGTAGEGKHLVNHNSHAFAYPLIPSQNTFTLTHTRYHLYSRIFFHPSCRLWCIREIETGASLKTDGWPKAINVCACIRHSSYLSDFCSLLFLLSAAIANTGATTERALNYPSVWL